MSSGGLSLRLERGEAEQLRRRISLRMRNLGRQSIGASIRVGIPAEVRLQFGVESMWGDL